MDIVLVEDDLALGRALVGALQDAGHAPTWLRTAAQAQARLASPPPPDALLLDLGLPDGDGTGLLVALRARDARLPVLVITARGALPERLAGLDLGADDYLVKPFAASELVARLRAVVRRGGADTGAVRRVRDLQLDEARMKVTRDGAPVHLSPTEFALLAALMRHPQRVLTRRELEARVLAHSDGPSLDVHVSNLRRRIGDGYIRTVRGVGYSIDD